MKKNKLLLSLFVIFCLILILSLFIGKESKNTKEYLNILTTVYNNGVNDDNGISMVLYLYDIHDKKTSKVAEIPITSYYPVGIYDVNNKKIYYSDSFELGEADNLFEYDLNTKEIKQLTFGKYLFNDIFIYNEKLYLNVAREYCTVTQPAIMDLKTKEITYLNPNDDDTWCFSLSYNYNTNKMLSLTTSDSIMRSHRVVAETHIRPKTLYMMDLDFGNYTPVFSTEDYEIALTRQLDDNRVLMTYDPQMAVPDPRKMKLLYLDSKKTEEINIPGIYEFHSFYPQNNAEGMFFTALDNDRNVGFFYYDFKTKKLENLHDTLNFPASHRSIVDFVCTIQ